MGVGEYSVCLIDLVGPPTNLALTVTDWIQYIPSRERLKMGIWCPDYHNANMLSVHSVHTGMD